MWKMLLRRLVDPKLEGDAGPEERHPDPILTLALERAPVDPRPWP